LKIQHALGLPLAEFEGIDPEWAREELSRTEEEKA